MTHIQTSSIISKLSLMLKDDISSLKAIQLPSVSSSDIQELIDSLVASKKNILELLPTSSLHVIGGAHPPQKKIINTYENSTNQSPTDPQALLNIFLEVEKGQQEFIRNSINAEGIPEELNNSLLSILPVYQKITSQLDRSRKTSQYNAIVI